MKKLILSVLAIGALTVTSCNKSDDDNNTVSLPTGAGNTVVFAASNFEGTVESGKVANLDANQTYQLTGRVLVEDGATLNIPAGTRIEATGGTSSYIAVAQGGKIYVNGTASSPVVMTSGSANPAQSDWGGVVVCGKANTNKGGSTGQTATSEVGDLTYGGTEDNDNSGSIRYLRIEYSGAAFNSSKEFNGLSLFGVGRGTTVEYVQSYEGGDDGIEFFGGTVDGRYLVATNSYDDSIDFADGWRGTGSYWYISGVTKAGIEGSNNGDNGAATPTTNATLQNITIVKGTGFAASEGGYYIKEGGGNVSGSNIYLADVTPGFKIKNSTDDPTGNSNVANDLINFTNVGMSNVATGTDYNGTASDLYSTGASATGAGNGAAVPTWAQGWTVGL